ncbi:hypothetical protein ASPWEDRAFT_30436 [Aspergillus wentii DTO 134E9]|uniref:Uncharacterized protein n=1 Tax=Aspergillus wentii DTO 134E9 TaxID=1073089 RepID=A0A1L9REK5_ASPWE|nr:uncharacterized protein ASPWEDRAFT_30436 [Aspergillus wentii DTO 134E9]OJJ33351.1 hypothetical protein ASPWEDRAFT_30436 [Aspergillus wentii DTO 134E9]
MTIHHSQTKAVFREGCLPERLSLYDCGVIGYLTLPKSTESEWVEIIPPEIKHIFQILGPRSNKLTITCQSYSRDDEPYYAAKFPILAEGYTAPCLESSEDEDYQFESDIVKSVPNAMEKYRAQYGRDTINVYWKVSDRELKLPEQRYELNRSGWKIVKQEPDLNRQDSHPYGPGVHLTLMREPVIVTDA